jgi:hypothetical protein
MALNEKMYKQMKWSVDTFKQVFPAKWNNIKEYAWVLIFAFARKESSFNPFALNESANDYGLFQFIPSTLEATIKLYQKDPKKIEEVKKNFYSKEDFDLAVNTQTFVFLNLIDTYFTSLKTKKIGGIYDDFLNTVMDPDLRTVLACYYQHAGGNAIFQNKLTKNYEMIAVLSLDILHIAVDVYKTFGIEKEISFNPNSIEANANVKGIYESLKLQYEV